MIPKEELELTSSFPCCPVNRKYHVKENPDIKNEIRNALMFLSNFKNISEREILGII